MRGNARRAARILRVLLPALVLASVPVTSRGGDPDLIVDRTALATSWRVEWRLFEPGHCALVEGCIGDAGWRRLLSFATETANIAMDDLVLGDPAANPLFSFSECHGHYHFEDYADYTLLDGAGQPAGLGHKQGFCLVDSIRYLDEPWVPGGPFYNCANQGIQRGWADIYDATLDCQWIDVTGVPEGMYMLRVTVNPEGLIEESDLTNNTTEIPVQIEETSGIIHRPDGRWVAGAPMRASRGETGVRIEHDVTVCPATDYNVFYSLSPPKLYDYDGGACAIGPSGDSVVALPDPPPGELVWFVVVGTEPLVSQFRREGGHGFDSAGRPRPVSGVGPLCDVVESEQAVICGQ